MKKFAIEIVEASEIMLSHISYVSRALSFSPSMHSVSSVAKYPPEVPHA